MIRPTHMHLSIEIPADTDHVPITSMEPSSGSFMKRHRNFIITAKNFQYLVFPPRKGRGGIKV